MMKAKLLLFLTAAYCAAATHPLASQIKASQVRIAADHIPGTRVNMYDINVESRWFTRLLKDFTPMPGNTLQDLQQYWPANASPDSEVVCIKQVHRADFLTEDGAVIWGGALPATWLETCFSQIGQSQELQFSPRFAEWWAKRHTR